MNPFKIKQLLFHTLTFLLLIGQLSISFWIFKLLHTGSEGFWMTWFVPILLGLAVFVMVFFLGIPLSGGRNHFGWGDWYFTLPRFKSFKKVYHSELGYFIIRISESGVNLYQQGWFRLTHLKEFTLEDPELLQGRIKKYLDDKYQYQVRIKKENDDINSKINKVKEWDGFLDTIGKRDEKINQLLK